MPVVGEVESGEARASDGLKQAAAADQNTVRRVAKEWECRRRAKKISRIAEERVFILWLVASDAGNVMWDELKESTIGSQQ